MESRNVRLPYSLIIKGQNHFANTHNTAQMRSKNQKSGQNRRTPNNRCNVQANQRLSYIARLLTSQGLGRKLRALGQGILCRRIWTSRVKFMTDQNGHAKPTTKPSDLDDFEKRLKTVQDKHNPPEDNRGDDGSLLGMAWRMSTELVVAVLVGAGLGWGLDKLFNTSPWILVVGIGFGFAAGIKNTLRTAAKMDALTADIPLGQDMPYDDEDDE